jgi:tetratricopeptide (TPR) repeat protein
VVAVSGLIAYRAVSHEHQYRELLGQGEAALRNRETFAAIEAFSDAIALHPSSMLPYLRRGETYHLRGDLEAASLDLRRASDLDPSSVRSLEALGNVLYEQGRLLQAAAAYERRLQLDDATPELRYRLALTRYRLGDYDGALEQLDRALALDATMVEAHYLRGLCLRDSGRLEEAAKALEAALVRSPGLIAAREELADVYGAMGEHGDELEQLQVIAGLDRQSVDRQLTVGLALARAARDARTPVSAQRNADLAILTLGRVLDRVPDQPQIHAALGRVWLDMANSSGDTVALSRALESLQAVATGPSASSALLSAYGQALALDGQKEAAEQVLAEATRRFPVAPESFVAYADIAELLGHLQEARDALISYDALVRDDDAFVSRARRIAGLSLRLEDPDTAVSWLERAMRSAPDDPFIVAALAEAHIAAGRDLEAREVVTRGLAARPDDNVLLALGEKMRLPN